MSPTDPARCLTEGHDVVLLTAERNVRHYGCRRCSPNGEAGARGRAEQQAEADARADALDDARRRADARAVAVLVMLAGTVLGATANPPADGRTLLAIALLVGAAVVWARNAPQP